MNQGLKYLVASVWLITLCGVLESGNGQSSPKTNTGEHNSEATESPRAPAQNMLTSSAGSPRASLMRSQDASTPGNTPTTTDQVLRLGLDRALKRRASDDIAKLISLGASLTTIDPEGGTTPFHRLVSAAYAYNDQVSVVTSCLDRKASPWCRDAAGYSVMQRACQHNPGNMDMLELLLDVEERDLVAPDDGNTIMHSLIEGMCDKFKRANFSNVLDMFCSKPEIRKGLIKYNKSKSTPFGVAISKIDRAPYDNILPVVRKLLGYQEVIDTLNDAIVEGQPVLHALVSKICAKADEGGSSRSMAALCAFIAHPEININVLNDKSETVIDFAKSLSLEPEIFDAIQQALTNRITEDARIVATIE